MLRILIVFVIGVLIFRTIVTNSDRVKAEVESSMTAHDVLLLSMEAESRPGIIAATLKTEDVVVFVVSTAHDTSTDSDTARWLCAKAQEHHVDVGASAIRDPNSPERYRFRAICTPS